MLSKSINFEGIKSLDAFENPDLGHQQQTFGNFEHHHHAMGNHFNHQHQMGRKKTFVAPKNNEQWRYEQAIGIVQHMKDRPARDNIRLIKKEIKNVDISNGVCSNTTSSTQINKQCQALSRNLQGYSDKDEVTRGHRMINAYYHEYKNMLNLSNFDCTTDQQAYMGGDGEKNQDFLLTVDF